MSDLSEQRAAVKLCFLSVKNTAETILVLKKAYKEEAGVEGGGIKWTSGFLV